MTSSPLPRRSLLAATTAAAALGLLATGCGEVLFMEVDVEGVCSQLPAQTIPGSPELALAGLPFQTTLRTAVNVESLLPDNAEMVEADVRLQRAIFRVEGEGASLDFLDALALQASGGTPPTRAHLLDWTRGPADSGAAELTMPSVSDTNLFPLSTEDGQVALELALTLRASAHDLRLVPILCFDARAQVNYGEAL